MRKNEFVYNPRKSKEKNIRTIEYVCEGKQVGPTQEAKLTLFEWVVFRGGSFRRKEMPPFAFSLANWHQTFEPL